MGTIGGIGMLSAGLLGGPGIGYFQDKYAAEDLKQKSEQVYDDYKAGGHPKQFLAFGEVTGLDGQKLGEVTTKDKDLKKAEAKGEKITAAEELTPDQKKVLEANLYGGKMALKVTSYVPAMMAVGYLLLVLYFRAKGGYKVEVLHGAKPEGEHYTGGVEGPVEA
jgi:hypothetical protein